MSRKTPWRSVSWMESLLDTPQFPLAQERISFPEKYCPRTFHGDFQTTFKRKQCQHRYSKMLLRLHEQPHKQDSSDAWSQQNITSYICILDSRTNFKKWQQLCLQLSSVHSEMDLSCSLLRVNHTTTLPPMGRRKWKKEEETQSRQEKIIY